MSLTRLKSVDVNTPEWQKRLRGIVGQIVRVNSDVRILVFGSVARHQVTMESDIDVAVTIENRQSPKEFNQNLRNEGPISKDWPVDLLVFPKDWYESRSEIGGVCFEIRRTGVELYPSWQFNCEESP